MTWKRIAIIGVVLAIAGYRWYSENRSAKPAQGGAETAQADQTRPDSDYLRFDGGKNLKSPGGLVYTSSRSGEHRTAHVLRHAADQPDRQGSHGVFDADGDDVFRLIDEAYELVKNKSRQVETSMSDGKTELTIDMKRRIGYRGGQSGQRDGKPALQRIKLILYDNRVITAYPY